MVLKLYVIDDGPPSMSVRQALAALKVPYELITMDYNKGEHKTDEFVKMNPQKEIPVLDDDGFYLSESNAMMQYICDKYKPGSSLYPTDPKARALINHRLCFNLSTFYPNVCGYTLNPTFYGVKRTPELLKKALTSLEVFDTYLTQLGTKYVAGDTLTIADFPFINTVMGLEIVEMDFSKYTKVKEWYENFKKNEPELWKITGDTIVSLKRIVPKLE